MDGACDVAVIGAGAAGVAALRLLEAARLNVRVLEAAPRIGGRARTVIANGAPADLGCEWLHDAENNPWTQIAIEQGAEIHREGPGWFDHVVDPEFNKHQMPDLVVALARFRQRVLAAASEAPDLPAAQLLDQESPWTPLIRAYGAYHNGVELDHVSVVDLAAYREGESDWRLSQGFGALIASAARDAAIDTTCPVMRIDHSGSLLMLDTLKGRLSARAVIVTVSTAVLAEEKLRFFPPLPDKHAAAADLPLGAAEKVFFAFDEPEQVPLDAHAFGDVRASKTGSYYLRPLGRPMIECFFAGDLAMESPSELIAIARLELAGLFGSAFAKTLRPLAASSWRAEPYILGSYSCAKVGRYSAREMLAASVDDRLFFAGEACSSVASSTAHGAFETGVAAAESCIRALTR